MLICYQPTHYLVLCLYFDANKEKERKERSPYWFLWAGRGTAQTISNLYQPFLPVRLGHLYRKAALFFCKQYAFVIFSSFAYLAASFKGKHYLEMSSNKVGCHQWCILILVPEIIWREQGNYSSMYSHESYRYTAGRFPQLRWLICLPLKPWLES